MRKEELILNITAASAIVLIALAANAYHKREPSPTPNIGIGYAKTLCQNFKAMHDADARNAYEALSCDKK